MTDCQSTYIYINVYSPLKELFSYKFIIIILCLGMVPRFLGNYSHYLLFLLLPLTLIVKFNRGTLLVILFSIFYCLAFILRGGDDTSLSMWIFYSLYPFILYQAGRYFGKKLVTPECVFTLVCLLSMCIGLTAVIDSIKDYIYSGQIINISRAITDAIDRENAISATGYGMMLALGLGFCCTFFINANSTYDRKMKIIIGCYAVLSLFATIHLVNRTGLVIAAASILVTLFLPPINRRKIRIILLMACVLFLIFNFCLLSSNEYSSILDAYDAREFDRAHDSSNAGGRTDLWIAGLIQMSENFWGSSKLYGMSNIYAHNLWIDAGIKGGVPSFHVLLIITFCIINTMSKLYRTRCFSIFERNTLLALGIVFFLQSFTEPIIEGITQFFWLFLFYWGILSEFLSKKILLCSKNSLR